MSAQPPLRILTAVDSHRLTLSVRASCLIFEDPTSKALLEPVQPIAPSEATALIIGETGVGKELIARPIHQWGRRSEEPFVAVNCAAISESWIEANWPGNLRELEKERRAVAPIFPLRISLLEPGRSL